MRVRITGFLAVLLATAVLLVPMSMATDVTSHEDSDAVGSSIGADVNIIRIQSLDDIAGLDAEDDMGDGVILIKSASSDVKDVDDIRSDLGSLVRTGKPLLFYPDLAERLDSDLAVVSTAFADDSDIYGLMYDPITGSSYCYSVKGSDDPLGSTYSLIKQSFDNESIRSTSTSPDPVVYSLTKECYSFGELIINTKYTKTEVSIDKYLVKTEYDLTVNPYEEDSIWDNWIAVSNMSISSVHENSDLLSAGPTTTSSSMTTHTVNLSATNSGTTVSDYWTYSINGADVTSSLNLTLDTFSVSHDCDEKGSYKTETKTMKPGKIAYCEKGSTIIAYQESEDYSATFYKDRTLLSDLYETEDCTVTVTLL